MIGAGSASFGLDALVGILRTPELKGARVSLVDPKRDALEEILAAGRRISDEWGADALLEATDDRREVLEGADFVVISVAVDREETWRTDRRIAATHGIVHYGENGGPGGLFHAARNIHTLAPILRDIEALAPDALVINFTNPLPRLCQAFQRMTSLRVVGLCHQLRFGYFVAGLALSEELGISVPADTHFTWTDGAVATELHVSQAAMERLSIRAAGLNHFTWMLDIRDRQSGESLLDAAKHNLVHRVPRTHPKFEPLTRQLCASTGHLPVSGDTHLCEYLPYTARESGWRDYAIQAYDHDWSEAARRARRAEISELAQGRGDVQALRRLPTERVEHLIAGVWRDSGAHEEALNLRNLDAESATRAISNLPDDAIVETPGTLHRDALRAEPVGALPEVIAEWCRREIKVSSLAVRAALERDRDLAHQALILDPTFVELSQVDSLLDSYLATYEAELGGPWD